MTGANIILGDFNSVCVCVTLFYYSYLGNMKYEPHLNTLEQRIWGPRRVS